MIKVKSSNPGLPQKTKLQNPGVQEGRLHEPMDESLKIRESIGGSKRLKPPMEISSAKTGYHVSY
jgi:hypothetical protein